MVKAKPPSTLLSRRKYKYINPEYFISWARYLEEASPFTISPVRPTIARPRGLMCQELHHGRDAEQRHDEGVDADDLSRQAQRSLVLGKPNRLEGRKNASPSRTPPLAANA